MAKSNLRLIPASELGDLPPTERLGLTKFVAGGLNVVFGPSGCYKSFYTLDAALRIAQSKPIVYVVGEGLGGIHRRVQAWCEHNRCGPGEAYFIGHEVNLMDVAEVKKFSVVAESVKPVVVIFDTLARCLLGGDENSAKDMGMAVSSASLLQEKLRTAVTWVHHTNKAERGERGSGALRGASDSMIEMFPNGDGSVRISCSKSKDEEPWVDEQYSFLKVLNSGVLVPTVGYSAAEYSDLEMRILDFLSLATFKTSGARIMQIVGALNIPERTIYRLLSHLKRDLLIDQGKKGDPFLLTDEGLYVLRQHQKSPPDITEIEVE